MPRKAKPELLEETYNAIKATARDLMAEHGTAGISMRAIARKLDMTAPALYYYFKNMDDLITALLLDAFNGMAQAIEGVQQTHANATPYEQLVESLMAYRKWAVEHKTEFQLAFGNPIPGYEAPRELTVPAAVRSQVALGFAIGKVLETDVEIPEHYATLPPHIEKQFKIIAQNAGEEDFPLIGVSLTISLWSDVQGLILMELIDHLPATVIYMDDWFRLQIERKLIDRGLTP